MRNAIVGIVVLYLLYRKFQRNHVVLIKHHDAESSEFARVVKTKEKLNTYKPLLLLRNGFIQTIVFNYFMPAPKLKFERDIMYFEKDGGCASLDWHLPIHMKPDDVKIVCLIFPALGTSCRTKYIRHLVHYFGDEANFECVVLNIRGSAGTKLTSSTLFSLAQPVDIHEMVQYVQKQRPNAKLVAVGASMGSNIMVRYLCEDYMDDHLIQAAVSISNPFDLKALMRTEQQFPFNFQYFRNMFESRFVEWFKRRLTRYEQLFRQHPTDSTFDFDHLMSLDTMESFSAYACQHFFGYNDFDQFLHDASCTNYIESLKVPTLFVQALDDMLVPTHLIPQEKLEAQEKAAMVFTETGGHIAFLDKNFKSWFLPISRAFLQLHFHQENDI